MDTVEEEPITTNAEDAMRGLVIPPVEEESTTTEDGKPVIETTEDGKKGTETEVTSEVDDKTTPASEVPEDDKFDAEIDAIEPLPSASKETKEAVRILKEKGKAEHKTAVEIRGQVTKLEAERKASEDRIKELEGKVITPETEKELSDLRQFRDTYGLEDDPALSQPFEKRITAANEATSEVMKQLGVPEATVKYITDNGGLYAFRLSNGLMPANVLNNDKSRMTHAQFYKRFIENNLTEGQKEELTDLYSEIRKTNREKSQAVQNLKSNREAYVAKRTESLKAAQEDWVNRVTKHSEVVLKSYGDVATLKDIPASASPEEKAKLEKHNENYKKAEARAQQILSTVTPENLTEAAIAAGYVDILKDGNADLQKQLDSITKERDELQKKYDDIKQAGKTSDLRGTAEAVRAAAGKGAKNAEEAMTGLVKQE